MVVSSRVFFEGSLVGFLRGRGLCGVTKRTGGKRTKVQLVRGIGPSVTLISVSVPIVDNLSVVTTLKASYRAEFVLSAKCRSFSCTGGTVSLRIHKCLLGPLSRQRLVRALRGMDSRVSRRGSEGDCIGGCFRFHSLCAQRVRLGFFRGIVDKAAVSPSSLRGVPIRGASSCLAVLVRVRGTGPRV